MYRFLLHFFVLMSTSTLIFSSQGSVLGNSNDRQFLNSGVRWVEWHPNQDALAIVYDEDFSIVSNNDQEIWLYTSSGQAITQLPIHPEQNVNRMEWSPDGNKLAIETYGSRLGGDFIFIFDTKTINSPSLIVAFPESHPTAADIAWSPDSSLLATNFYGYIKVWNVSSGELVSTIESDELGIDRIAWNSDGSRLAGGTSGRVLIWDISNPDESLLTTLAKEPTSYYDIKWDPGGHQLAVANYNNIDIWEWDATTSSYQQVATLTGHNERVRQLDWKVDKLASLGLDFTVRVWDTNSWQLINVFPTSNDLGTQNALSLSPDGTQVAYAGIDGSLNIEPVLGGIVCDINIPIEDISALITAITTANSSGQPTTICLAEGSTYTFTAIHNHDNALPRITGDITIEGNGATLTRSGTAQFRFFEVLAGGKLTLKNLTLSNGNAGDEPGGAIFNFGEVTLSNTTFSGNTAYTGGAIDNQAGTVTITDSRFLNNTATQNAGAIYNSGVATASAHQSCFTGNSMTAVYNYNTTAQDFTHNWWGAVNGPSGAGPGSGDSVSAKINFTPFVTTGCPWPG